MKSLIQWMTNLIKWLLTFLGILTKTKKEKISPHTISLNSWNEYEIEKQQRQERLKQETALNLEIIYRSDDRCFQDFSGNLRWHDNTSKILTESEKESIKNIIR